MTDATLTETAARDATPSAAAPVAIIGLVMLLLTGSAFRLIEFLRADSLWIDEAVLADNIVTRDYARLTDPLDHAQLAPVGYLWLERLAVDCFGPGERPLRLVSLVAGLLTLPALWLMARRLLSPVGALALIAMAAFSLPLIDYSSEVKPYAVDVLATVVLLWLGSASMQKNWSLQSLSTLCFAGACFVWVSLPSLFVIAGILIVAAMLHLAKGRRDALPRIIALGALPAVSFASHFLLFLRPSMGNQALHDFWAGDFVPLPPKSLQQIEWFLVSPLHYFTDPGGFTAIGLALLLTLAGMAILWRRGRTELLLILTPILLLMIASALRKYPTPVAAEAGAHWYGRLILFTLPVAFLLIAASLDLLWRSQARFVRAAALLLLLLLLLHPMIQIARHLKSGKAGGDVRDVLRHLHEQVQPNDVVYPNWPMRQLAAYYRHRIKGLDPAGWLKTHPVIVRSMLTDDAWTRFNDWSTWTRQLDDLRGRRVWLLISHEPSAGSAPDERFLLDHVRRHGRILDQLKNEEASLYLVVLNPSAQP